MFENPFLACSLTPLALGISLFSYMIVFLTPDVDRRREFLDIVYACVCFYAFALHFVGNVCDENMSAYMFRSYLDDFFVIPLCMYSFFITTTRFIIERLQVSDICRPKTILFFTLLESILILYVYYSVQNVFYCPRLHLCEDFKVSCGLIRLDFFYVESMHFVLKWWFLYCIWRVKFLPYGDLITSTQRARLQHFVWIFMIFAGFSFLLIDLANPHPHFPTDFFVFTIGYTLLEYFCVSKLYAPTHVCFFLCFVASSVLTTLYWYLYWFVF